MAARPRGVALLLLAAALSACVQDDGSRFNPLRPGLISEDREREIGREFDLEIHKHLRLIDDPLVNDFINDLGQHMVRQIEPQPFIYRFRIVDDPRLNAFAVPGGYIYFHSATLMSAGSIEELAGVMGHEIAHVKARHFARGQQQKALPELLANLAGLAAAGATGEPGAAIVAIAANVALQLRWSREFETEADRFGTIFMSRAGFDPHALVRFFERLVDEKEKSPVEIPPYLYSHPDVEDRIASVERMADRLVPLQPAPAELSRALRGAQARLAQMGAMGRTALPPPALGFDREASEAALARAGRLEQTGDAEAALRVLADAEILQPYDPRLPFQTGELWMKRRRPDRAVIAYRRALALDPQTGLLLLQLGRAYKSLGDRNRAVYYLERARARFGSSGRLREQADRELLRLTFPVLGEAGLADGVESEGSDTVAGATRERFDLDDASVVWWGRLNPRWVDHAEELRVRWQDPSGRLVQEGEVERRRRVFATARLDLAALQAPPRGLWSVEVLLEGDVVDRRNFPVGP